MNGSTARSLAFAVATSSMGACAPDADLSRVPQDRGGWCCSNDTCWATKTTSWKKGGETDFTEYPAKSCNTIWGYGAGEDRNGGWMIADNEDGRRWTAEAWVMTYFDVVNEAKRWHAYRTEWYCKESVKGTKEEGDKVRDISTCKKTR